jgi:hypothetical protein
MKMASLVDEFEDTLALDVFTRIFAQEQHEFEVTKAMPGWFWRDENCDKSATDMCLTVAAAFGEHMCSRPHISVPIDPHPKKY